MGFCNSYQYHSNGAAAGGSKGQGLPSFSSSLIPANGFHKPDTTRFQLYNHNLSTNRLVSSVQGSKAVSSSNSNVKIAYLTGRRKEGVVFPSNKHKSWKEYPISEFLSHPSGVEAIMNTKASQSFQLMDSNTYRCTVQSIQLFDIEVIPVFDLRVTPTTKDCTIEMLSCKFEGSEVVKRSSNRYSAFMKCHITWDTNGSAKPRLDVDMNMSLSFEIYELPFTLLPVSAVETPGNLMMQALVDNHARQLLLQLLQHYDEWVHKQQHQVST